MNSAPSGGMNANLKSNCADTTWDNAHLLPNNQLTQKNYDSGFIDGALSMPTSVDNMIKAEEVLMPQSEISQPLRNSNLSLRCDIPNPKQNVSPWNISTIETVACKSAGVAE